MNNNRVNILVVGLLSTGSSALIDILREYSNINTLPGEFNDFRAPGLVADQLKSAPYYINNEINRLITIKGKIRWVYNIFPFLNPKFSIFKGVRDRYKYSMLRLKQLSLLEKLNSKIISEKSLEEKFKFSNEWIREVGNIEGENKDYIIFNQPLLPSIETNVWKKVFNPFKLIIVYRDPKDQLAEIIKKGNLFAPFGDSNLNLGGVTLETIYGRSRDGALRMHIDAIKRRFEWIDSLKKDLKSEEFLLVDFEGLIYNYPKYRNKIEDFIGNLSADKEKRKMYFDPENAKLNIGIYSQFLSLEEQKTLKELNRWYETSIKENLIQ